MSESEKKRAPLLCTANRGEHIDYGIPILFAKSNDYRTSTKRAHDFVPSVPQNFDCNVKASINPQLLNVDLVIKDEGIKSTYDTSFNYKVSQDHPLQKCSKPPRSNDYGRVVEEKMIMDPPPPGKVRISEMKDNYRMNFYTPRRREVQAPVDIARCKVKSLGRDEQPPVRPEEKGFWKHLDIYMTENRLKYPPHSVEAQQKAREDIVTYYSATGKWRGFNDTIMKTDGNKTMYDRKVFKSELPWRTLSNGQKHVPNFGMTSTYRDSYLEQNYSDMYPYIASKNNPITFDVSMEEAGPWQTISPPGMYCSENCHIGTGWPIRSVVEIGKPEQKEHVPCTTKVTD